MRGTAWSAASGPRRARVRPARAAPVRTAWLAANPKPKYYSMPWYSECAAPPGARHLDLAGRGCALHALPLCAQPVSQQTQTAARCSEAQPTRVDVRKCSLQDHARCRGAGDAAPVCCCAHRLLASDPALVACRPTLAAAAAGTSADSWAISSLCIFGEPRRRASGGGARGGAARLVAPITCTKKCTTCPVNHILEEGTICGSRRRPTPSTGGGGAPGAPVR